MRTIVLLCIAVSLSVSCQKNEDASKPLIQASAAPSAAPAPVAVASTPSALPSIPIEEDFEQKAEAAITASNVNQELDKLKQEIGQ